MSQNLGRISLDTVIKDYLNESEQNINKYFKCYHIAFTGFEEMGLDFFYKVQSVKLPINANMTVTLPANYLNWTKIGVLNQQGQIIPLWRNENFTTFSDLSTDRITNTTEGAVSQNWGWDGLGWGFCNYWNGYAYTNIYGVPSGQPVYGTFKVDNNNGVILLNEHYNYDYIMLEYVSSPQEGAEYYLPIQFRQALIAYLWWKDGKARPITSHMKLGASRDAKHEYYNERRNAIARYKPSRYMDIYQASQEQMRQAIKT